ncbi:MAG: FkbM family methyltransferase [Chloroflexi bacterium]|nr:FkbM family methyltransferase [Chloroflexota bacterium]
MPKRWQKQLRYQLSMCRYHLRQAFFPHVARKIHDRGFVLRNVGLSDRIDYDDAWFVALALRSEVVFDIGANLGLTALLTTFSSTVRNLVLVDPNPMALSIAAENFITNHLSAHVHFVCAFVSDHSNETVRLWTVDVGAAGSMYKSHAITASTLNKSLEATTTTIDDLCTCYGLIPNLVKIDVEGAEALVVQGSSQCASHNKTRYLVEVHANPEISMEENTTRILRWCGEAGYRAWYMKEAFPLENPEPIAHRGRCHLLLQPAEWEYPEWLRSIPEKAEIAIALESEKR